MKRKNDLFARMSKSRLIAEQELFCDIVFKELEEHFLVDSDYILNKTRKREYVWARQLGMFIISKHTKISLSDIGRMYNKDHATVIHAKRVIEEQMEVSKKTKSEVKSIESKILSKFGIFRKNPKSDEQFYYINFDNYISVRISDKKGIILTGFSDKDVFDFLTLLKTKNVETMKHKKTGHYILEQKTK